MFRCISLYLKEDGVFIFSWKHPLHGCVVVDGEKLIFDKSYFYENWQSKTLDDMEIVICNRKISTYINALSSAGFIIENMIAQTDKNTLQMKDNIDDRSMKAQKLPLSFVIKARKL